MEWVEKVAARHRLPLRSNSPGCTGKAAGCSSSDLGMQPLEPALQPRQREHEGKPGMRSMRSSHSSEGSSRGDTSSSGGGGQPAAPATWQVQPVTEDARGWVKEAFTAESRLST